MTDVPAAPRAAQRPVVRSHHGDDFTDNYDWLRDKEDAEVIAHLEAENAYTDARTTHLAPLRQRIFDEIKSRTQETDLSVPSRRGDWWYYGRTVAGKQYGIQCRAPLADADDWTPPSLSPDTDVPGEEVLFDANVAADGHEFFALGSFDVSNDGTHLLWASDVTGDELYTLRIRNLVDDVLYDDVLERTAGGAEFTPDGSGVIYSTLDDAWRPDRVWFHRVGTPQDQDVQLFHEPDERFWLGAGFTRSERYLLIEMASSVTSESFLVDADDLFATPRSVWPRTEGIEYSVDHAIVGGEDVLYIVHNDNALDFELVRVAASDPLGEREVVLPHVAGRRVDGIDCFRDFAIVGYRREGLERLARLDYTGAALHELPFDEELFSVGIGGNAEWAPRFIRLGYTSYVTPRTVFDWDVESDELVLRKRQPVLGDYDPEAYAQRRIWATAEDGTRIPVSVVWRRSFGEVGASPRPVHLYGYGSYEAPMDPGFSIARLSELDRGIVFVVAHVRGGGELGRSWYEQGKLLRKRNSFTDFVAVAQHLVDSGYTTPDRLVAEGGSAGGLLMGAITNLAPELFAGVLAGVPFVDALTTILDPSLPLTVVEWDEWGNPLDSAEVYAYMKSYTPYENVREGVRYPQILATTSLNDSRVMYVEPAKWVARLRDVEADAMLKCEMVAGHGGVTGRYNSWHERAFELAWLFDVLGVADTE